MQLLLSTWKDVEAYLIRLKGIIVPLGSIEQHGPSGLIGTDTFCAKAIADFIGIQAGVMVGPDIPFGVAPFNLAFPGTISTRASTLMALIEDYVRSLARHGFEQFYFLNGHGANVAPLRAASQDLYAANSYNLEEGRIRMRIRLRNWWDYPTVNKIRHELYGDWEGMHATPSEIAMTQALYPDQARVCESPPPEKLTEQYLRDHAGDNHGSAEHHRRRFPDGRVGSDFRLGATGTRPTSP